MKRDTLDIDKYQVYAYALIFSLFLSKYSIQIGFHLKPYMIVTFVGALIFRDEIISFDIINDFKYYNSFFLYLSFYIITITYSINKTESFRWVALIFINISFLVINSKILTSKRINHVKILKNIAPYIIIISLLSYVMGLLKLNFDYSVNRVLTLGVLTDRGIPRLIGIISHDPNIAMYNLTILFFLFLIYNNSLKDKLNLFFIALTVILTFSRGGMVAYIISIVIFLIIKMDNSIIKKVIKIISLAIAIDLLYSYFQQNSILTIIYARFKNSISTGGSGRTQLWKASFETAKSNILFGTGINTSKFSVLPILGHPKYIHNTFLEVLTDGGLILLFFFINHIKTLFFHIRKMNNRNMMLFYGLSLVAMLIQSVFLSLSINEFWFVYIMFIRLEFFEEGVIYEDI